MVCDCALGRTRLAPGGCWARHPHSGSCCVGQVYLLAPGAAGPTQGGGHSEQTPLTTPQLLRHLPQHTKNTQTSSGLTSHALCFQNYLTFRLPWSVKGPHCVRTHMCHDPHGVLVRCLLLHPDSTSAVLWEFEDNVPVIRPEKSNVCPGINSLNH